MLDFVIWILDRVSYIFIFFFFFFQVTRPLEVRTMDHFNLFCHSSIIVLYSLLCLFGSNFHLVIPHLFEAKLSVIFSRLTPKVYFCTDSVPPLLSSVRPGPSKGTGWPGLPSYENIVYFCGWGGSYDPRIYIRMYLILVTSELFRIPLLKLFKL